MNKLLIASIAIIVVGAISVFAISPYFTESTIDEAIPTGAIIQSQMENKDKFPIKNAMEDETMMDEEEKMDTMMDEEEKMDTMMDEEEKMDTMMEKEEMVDTMMDEVMAMSFAGEFIGVGDGVHDAQGDAYTIPLENDSSVLRLENFKSTNGPDLYVYLSTDNDASEFVNLGKLKASNGNQNYEIPEDTDLGKYNKVLIWCKAFGVLFGSAELSSK